MYKTIHLKAHSTVFSSLLDGSKPFEFREKRDRDFQVGDVLIIQECDPETEVLSGREVERIISYILDEGKFGVPVGYCVLGFGVYPKRIDNHGW